MIFNTNNECIKHFKEVRIKDNIACKVLNWININYEKRKLISKMNTFKDQDELQFLIYAKIKRTSILKLINDFQSLILIKIFKFTEKSIPVFSNDFVYKIKNNL